MLESNSDGCKKPTIIQGEDKTLTIKLVSSDTKYPVDLSTASEIKAILLNTDNTYTEKLLSTGGIALVSGPGGAFSIFLTAADTLALAVSPQGAYSDIEIHFVISSKTGIVLLTNSVQIIPRRYPSAP